MGQYYIYFSLMNFQTLFRIMVKFITSKELGKSINIMELGKYINIMEWDKYINSRELVKYIIIKEVVEYINIKKLGKKVFLATQFHVQNVVAYVAMLMIQHTPAAARTQLSYLKNYLQGIGLWLSSY